MPLYLNRKSLRRTERQPTFAPLAVGALELADRLFLLSLGEALMSVVPHVGAVAGAEVEIRQRRMERNTSFCGIKG